MSPSIYINTALGSCLILLLIFADYVRKFNTNEYMRKLLLAMLTVALAAVLTDFVTRFLAGRSGRGVAGTMYAAASLFLVFQNCSYYLGAVFIDYFAYNDVERSKKIICAVCVFLGLHALSVIVNLFFGFYFTISAANIYTPGSLYLLRLILSYASVLFMVIDISLASKYFKQSQAYLIIFFMLITGSGAALDVMLREGSLAWPCFAAAVLYLYFFIIRSDSKLDSLTGIGNRYSFNEFIEKLSRQNTKEDYTIVMIDMDRFKEINDTLGHLEGDNALRDMAAIIKGCIRHSDFAARYGGDEFILAAKAEYDMQRLMDRIQGAIDIQNEKRARPYQIYMSYGYDVYTTNSGRSIQDFITHIDALMYNQKKEHHRAGIPSAITARIGTASSGKKAAAKGDAHV
jgi:diguanylate cyclase (GGDEF)-like protein